MSRFIYYRPIERHWYRLVDFVQPRYHRFSRSNWGLAVGWTIKVLARLLWLLAGAVVIVTASLTYMMLMFVLGGKTRRR
jgi:hypothetical protein